MSSFSYPRLSRPEIVAYLDENQIAAVADADLQRPNPDFISLLYARLLIFLGFLQEDHSQVDFMASDCLGNPDQHIDSVRVMNLLRKMKQILSDLQCPTNFTLKDLIKPVPDRTEIFLSAIINFSIYRESKMELLKPIVEECSVLEEQRQGLEHRKSELNEEIAQINESRENELPIVKEVEAEVKELKQTIHGLNNHQMSLKASIRKMKDKAQETDEKIVNAQYALVQVAMENKSLRSKIVQSPDKLQGALEEKRLVRDEAKNAERQAMQSYQKKEAIHEAYTKSCKKMSKSLAQMQTIQEQVSSAKAIEKDVKALKAKKSDEEMLDKSLQAKLVERQAKVEQLDESRKQLEKERNLRCEEATKELNNVKLQVESMRRELESRQAKVEAVVAEAGAVTTKCNSVKACGAAKRDELLGKAQEIAKEFYDYSNSIGVLLPGIKEVSQL